MTTTAATKVGEGGASRALLGHITDGSSVTVAGPSSDGTIAAFLVIIANPAQQHPQPPPGMLVVKGTVSDASTAGFTVVTSGGTRVPVTTSSDTVVSDANASLGQFPAGATILGQLDRRGARRDQRGTRPRGLIRQTPMMAGAATHAVPAIACANRGAPLIPAGSRVR